MTVLLVAVGGALGAAARYLLDRAIATHQTGPFPLGTLVINVSGSIALGLLFGLAVAHQLPASVVTLVGTGFLGAYTQHKPWRSPALACGCPKLGRMR